MDRTYAEFLAHITPWLPQIGSISLHIEQLLLEEIVIAHELHDFRVLVEVIYWRLRVSGVIECVCVTGMFRF